MERKVLLAVVLLLVCSVALAQRVCPPPVRAGECVRITPTATVVAVECPRGMIDGQAVLEKEQRAFFDNNRSLSMWVRPYGGAPGLTELAFMLTKGYGNWDNATGLDVWVRGESGKQNVRLRRLCEGRFCGQVNLGPGWNKVNVWVTEPTGIGSHMVTFDVWGGSLNDKPRYVNWQCGRCKTITVSTSCPVCTCR